MERRRKDTNGKAHEKLMEKLKSDTNATREYCMIAASKKTTDQHFEWAWKIRLHVYEFKVVYNIEFCTEMIIINNISNKW